MAKFTSVDELEKHLKKALDALQAEILVTVQAELGSAAVSPVDTGRFRSSWFAAEGNSSDAVAPEGADNPSNDAMGLRVDATKEYHLTNNLVYAQSVAIEGNVVSKPRTWFTSFRNSRIPKIQKAAAAVVKAEYGL